jgi:hypothetical protein
MSDYSNFEIKSKEEDRWLDFLARIELAERDVVGERAADLATEGRNAKRAADFAGKRRFPAHGESGPGRWATWPGRWRRRSSDARADHAAPGAAHLREPDDRGRREREGALDMHGALVRDDHLRPLRPLDARKRGRGRRAARCLP